MRPHLTCFIRFSLGAVWSGRGQKRGLKSGGCDSPGEPRRARGDTEETGIRSVAGAAAGSCLPGRAGVRQRSRVIPVFSFQRQEG